MNHSQGFSSTQRVPQSSPSNNAHTYQPPSSLTNQTSHSFADELVGGPYDYTARSPAPFSHQDLATLPVNSFPCLQRVLNDADIFQNQQMPNDPFLHVSHSGNQPLPSSSAAVEVSSFPNVASHPRSQTPPASSATTPHYLNERAALTDEEYFRMIDDCLAAAHVDLLDQAYGLQSISELALLWDLPVAGGARTVSPQFLAVNPSACWRVPPSGQDSSNNHSLSQPGAFDGNQHQYVLQTQDPGGEAGFTEELVRLFSVRSHAGRGSEGDVPCLMCRRKFTKACQSLRHMEQCHILHKIWVCNMGGCAGIKTEAPKHRLLSPDSHGNVFHRKDNFTSHLVAKHGVADSEARNSTAESVEFVRCPLPTELRCSVAGCKIGYEGGDNVLDKLLKHITKDHAADLDHSYTWRNAILPYLLSRNIVVRGPAGLRPAAHDDVPAIYR